MNLLDWWAETRWALGRSASAVRALRTETLEPRVLLNGAPVDAAAIAPASDQVALIEDPAAFVAEMSGTQTAESAPRRELVLIDRGLPDAEALLSLLDETAAEREILWIEGDHDVDDVGDAIRERADGDAFDAIHLLSHGDAFGFAIGTTRVDGGSIDSLASDLTGWRDLLTADGDFLIYGCSVAETTAGQGLVSRLSELTGADVATSDDLTGHVGLGGDWVLEFRVGEIETVGLSAEPWGHVLTSTTVTFRSGVDAYTGTRDTYVDETDATTAKDFESEVQVRGGTDDQHAVLRFIDIFGSGANQIPAGATITSASIQLNVTNTTTGQISFHKALADYGNATWDSVGNGLQTDDVEVASTPDFSFTGSTSGSITLSDPSIAASVQSWLDGGNNFGWAIFTGSSDRWAFTSSNNAALGYRPLLSVTYTTTPPVTTVTVSNATDIVNGTTTSIAALIASDGGDGISLREALLAAGNTAGHDTIEFAIGTGLRDLSITSALPTLDDVTLDATTQPGYTDQPLIMLQPNGGYTGAGLTLQDNVTLKGLSITNFTGNGIDVLGGNNTIQGNWIGVTQAGASRGNSGAGVALFGTGEANNVIGGVGANESNTVAFNSGGGIFVSSGTDHFFRDNAIHSNSGLGNVIFGTATSSSDWDDADTGQNNLLNQPEILAVVPDGTDYRVQVYVQSNPSTLVTVDLLAALSANSRESLTTLAAHDVTTNGDGFAVHEFVVAAASLPTGTQAFSAQILSGDGSSFLAQSVGLPSAGVGATATFSIPGSTVNDPDFRGERRTSTRPVAIANDGRRFVVWTENDGAGSSVWGRLISADGTTGTTPVKLNETSGTHHDASVSVDASGRFVVVWAEQNDNDGHFRLVNADGTLNGGEQTLFGAGLSAQFDLDVVKLPTGEFLVGWTATTFTETSPWIGRYDADGNWLGGVAPEKLENTNGNSPRELTIAANHAGVVTAVWEEDDGLHLRQYDALTDSLIGASDTHIGNGDDIAITALPDGRFFLAISDSSGGTPELYGQFLQANGSFDGARIRLDEAVGASGATVPTVSADWAGRIAIGYESGNGLDSYYKVIDATGATVVGESDVPLDTGGHQDATVVSFAPGTETLWLTYHGRHAPFSSDDSIYARAVSVPLDNAPPVVDAGGPYTIQRGAPITLDASGTYDPDGDPLTFAWDLDNDGNFGEVNESTSETETVSWGTLTTFGINNPGVYTIGLRVSDGHGAVVDLTSIQVLVNGDPVASTGGPYTIDEGGSLTLDASGSSDPNGDTLTYRWDLDNDGNFTEAGEPSGVNPTVGWSTLQSFGVNDDGTYTVGLQVDDGNGGVVTTTASVTVNDVAPTISVSGTGSATAGSAYTLTFSASDPGDDAITGWVINWGDGTIDTVAGDPGSATHTYSAGGRTFDVTVAAVNGDGTWFNNDLLVNSAESDSLFRFDPVTGAFAAEFGIGDVDSPLGAVIGPDGLLYVGGWLSDEIVRYNPTTGANVGTFVTAGSGGLADVGGLAFGADGHLYVSSYASDQILRYDGTTGAFIDVFVSAGAGGLDGPADLRFLDNGDVLVASFRTDEILRFSSSGASLGTFVAAGSGGLDQPEGLSLGPDGHLYVASYATDEILRFDGVTGASMGAFVTAGSGGLNGPLGLTWGPDGHLYVGSERSDQVLRFNGATGAFIDVYSAGNGLDGPQYLIFTPSHRVGVASSNSPPVADAGGAYTIDEGGSLTLDASGSSDPNGDTLTYRWDLDNDGNFAEAGEPSGVNPTVDWSTLQSFGVNDDGTYTVGLQVDDGNGGVVTTTASVTVNDVPPTIAVNGAGTATTTSAYTLSLVANGDPGDDTVTGWIVNWGDGQVQTVAGGSQTVTHTYAVAGRTYNVTASAINEDGTWHDSDLFVAGRHSDRIHRYDPVSGDFSLDLGAGTLLTPHGLAFGPDGRLYASDHETNAVYRFDPSSGAFIDTFIAAGSGGMGSPKGMAFGSDGLLYVADASNDQVMRFDASTGAFVDVFSDTGPSSVNGASELLFLDNGDLLVSREVGDNVVRVDGATGAVLGEFIAAGSGGLDRPQGLAMGPDGHLYVSSGVTHEVLRYDGTTGAFIDTFVTAGAGGLDNPSALAFGPDGALYVSSQAGDAVLRFDASTGTFIDTYASGGGLDGTRGLAFAPAHRVTVTNTPVGAVSDADSTANVVAESAAINDVVGLTASASDPDGGDTVSYSLDDSAGGRFAINSNTGVVTVAAGLDHEANATHDITVRATSSDGTFSTSVFTIDVSDVDEPPTISGPTTASVSEAATSGTSVASFAGSDPEAAGALTWSIVESVPFTMTSAGDLLVNGSLDFETTTSYAMTVRATDSGGRSTDHAVTVSITNANEDPTVSGPSSLNVHEDAAVGTSVATYSATDPDAGSTVSYSLVGSVPFSIHATTGVLTVNGALDFESTPSYSFTVRASDGVGGTDDFAVVLGVSDVNEGPTITGVSTVSVSDAATPGTTIASFPSSDPDAGDVLSWSVIGGGPFTMGGNNLIVTGPLDFATTPSYSLTIRVTDAGGLTDDHAVTVNVTDGNVAPSVSGPATINVGEHTAVGATVGTYTATDANVGDVITYSLIGSAPFSINATTGEMTLSSGLDFETTTSYSFTVRADDGQGGTDDLAVTVTVTDENDAPVLTGPTTSGVLETAAIGTLVGTYSAADVDAGDTVTYSVIGAVPFEINAITGALTVDGVLDAVATPSYSFTVRATDSSGATDDLAVTISVTDVPDPLAISITGPGTVDEGSSVTLDASGVTGGVGPYTYDWDIDGDGSFETSTGGNSSVVVPGASNAGPSTRTISVRVTDSLASTETATHTLTVNNVAPTAVDDDRTVQEGSSVSVSTASLLTNDTDPSDVVTFVSIDSPAAGQGTLTDNGDGTYTFAAGADFEHLGAGETADVVVTYRISDGDAVSAGQLTIRVAGLNDGPVAGDDTIAVTEDVAFHGDLLTNDADADGDTLTTSLATGPANGAVVVNANGTFTYTPAADFAGTDSFTYTVTDGTDVDTATVTVHVAAVNDAPVATDSATTVVEDGVGAGSLVANATDADGDTLTFALAAQATHGTATVAANGAVTYTPDANFNGTDTFTWSVTDGTETRTATVTVTVTPTNDAPVIADATAAVDAFEAANTAVATLAASDVDGDALTYAIVSGNSGGAFRVDGAGVIRVDNSAALDPVLATNWTLTVGANDGTVTTTATVTITLGNNAPVAANDLASVNEDGSVTIDVIANDSDPDGSPLATSLVTGPTHGSVIRNGDDTFTYTPDANYGGTDSFRYEISDGVLTAEATVSITVSPVNDRPNVVAQSFTVAEQAVNGTVLGTIAAVDIDGDPLTFTVVGGTGQGALAVDTATGQITVADGARLDFETTATETLVVQLSDPDGAERTRTMTVTVTDVAEPPTIADRAYTVSEEAAAGDRLGFLTASDPNGSDLSYTITGQTVPGLFVVNEATGAVRLSRPVDFETDPTTMTVTVRVTNDQGYSDTGVMTVTITDGNDRPTSGGPRTFEVPFGETLDVLAADGLLVGASDSNGDPLEVVLVGAATRGELTLNADGSFRFINSHLQSARFLAAVTDGQFQSDPFVVEITTASIGPGPGSTPGTALGSQAGSSSGSTADSTTTSSNESSTSRSSSDSNTNASSTSSSGSSSSSHSDGGEASATGESTAEANVVDSAQESASSDVTVPGIAAVNEVAGPSTDLGDAVSAAATDSTSNAAQSSDATGPAGESNRNSMVRFEDGSTIDAGETRWNANGGSSGGGSRDGWFSMFTSWTGASAPVDETWQQYRANANVVAALDATEEAVASERPLHNSVGQVAVASGTVVTVGYVAMAIRSGALVTGLLAQMPAWRIIDPLVVLDALDDTDGESLESMIDDHGSGESRPDERDLTRLNPNDSGSAEAY